MWKLVLCFFGREKVHKVDFVFTFVAGDKLLGVSVKKYLGLFSRTGEKFGYSRKIVVGGGTGIAAGAEEEQRSERQVSSPFQPVRVCSASSQCG